MHALLTEKYRAKNILLGSKVEHLYVEDAEKIRCLLMKHDDLLATSLDYIRPGSSRISTKHYFSLVSGNTIFEPYRRLSPAHNEIVCKEVDRMYEAGIISPVESAWAFPVVITAKKDGGPRLCIDYRRLNKVVKTDRWLMPHVDETLEEQVEANISPVLTCSLGTGKSVWTKAVRK